MRWTTAVAVATIAATPWLAAQQPAKPQPPDRPIRTTATRALVHVVAFAPDNVSVTVWDANGFARWNADTNKVLERQPVIAKACGEKRAPLLPRSEDGRSVAVSCAGKLVFFDAGSGASRGELKVDPKQMPTVYTASPEGGLIATVAAGATSTINVVDGKSGERRAQIQNEQEVQQMSFSTSGDRLVTGAVDGVRVWQLPDGKLLRTIPGGTFHAISADGQTLAMERGRDVAIVELATGTVKRTLPGSVSQLRFSHDGTLLAGWNNQQLTVWDVAGGSVKLTLKASQLVTVALAPDAKHLAAVAMELAGGAAETSIGVWRIPAQ